VDLGHRKPTYSQHALEIRGLASTAPMKYVVFQMGLPMALGAVSSACSVEKP